MKVLQAPFTYYPDPVGGTEIYVEALAQQLLAHEVRSVIAAPAPQNGTMEREGLQVRRYALSKGVPNLRDIYGEGDETAATNFDRILAEEKPDVVHFHAFTSGASLRAVRFAKRRGMPVVFTYHTPTVSCLRGTLLRWDAEVCDGVMDVRMCAGCNLHAHGLNRALAQSLARLPEVISAMPGRLGLSGRLWTAWRGRELAALRHAATRSLFTEVDHIVAVSEWVRQVLLRNGVPSGKITLSRQGLCQPPDRQRPKPCANGKTVSGPLKVAFFGRLHPTKGIDVLVRALRMRPEPNLSLDIYGIGQGAEGQTYSEMLRQLAAGDSRITFRAPVSAGSVVGVLADYDLLAVPSQWLESGPMVVLEAFAAGVPVIGSRLGGLTEIIRDGKNGILVDHASISAWANALRELARDRARLTALHANILPPRTMATVADEMAALYRGMHSQRSPQNVASVR